jgi:hypothetical protein
MPYITQDKRDSLDPLIDRFKDTVLSPGELNYVITRLVTDYIHGNGGQNYEKYNAAVGVLECAKLELYRTQTAPYEDIKREQNGHVPGTPGRWT